MRYFWGGYSSFVVGGRRVTPPQRSADCTGRCLGQAPGRGNPIPLVSARTAGRRTLRPDQARHPEVQAEIDRVYQEHLAKLSKKAA